MDFRNTGGWIGFCMVGLELDGSIGMLAGKRAGLQSDPIRAIPQESVFYRKKKSVPGFSRTVPNLAEAVALDFFNEQVAVDGHERIDVGTAGFEGVAGPNVADSGEVVGLG